MVSACTQMSLLRRHGSHSPGQLFSLSLVEAEDGWSRFSLSKAGQLIQQWWLPCNFLMAQSPCNSLNENNFQFGGIVSVILLESKGESKLSHENCVNKLVKTKHCQDNVEGVCVGQDKIMLRESVVSRTR